MVDENFFLQARHKVRAEWFVDAYDGAIWKAVLDFHNTYHRRPTTEELTSSPAFLQAGGSFSSKMVFRMEHNTRSMHLFGLDVVKTEMTLWLRSVIFKKELEHATDIFNQSGDPKCPDAAGFLNRAFLILRKAASDIDQTQFETSQAVDFSDIATGTFFDKKKEELKTGLVFGCDLVDDKLNSNRIAPGGALLRGDHTLLVAPTNVGKTTTMLSVAKENLRRFKDVKILLLTHEGTTSDIKTKIISSVTGKTFAELDVLRTTEEGREKLKHVSKILNERLVYVPYTKAGGTVEDVDAIIRQQQERAMLRGRGFDMLICDYPAKLFTKMAEKGWQTRHIIQYVYSYFTQIGLELNCHVLSAIQTNREGSRLNNKRKGSEERLLGVEDVSEAYEATHTPTNVITLNRDPLAEMRNRITFHIAKSRGNTKGWSIVSKTDMSRSISHGADFPATAYRGQSPMSEKIDDFLASYPGVSIPEGLYL